MNGSVSNSWKEQIQVLEGDIQNMGKIKDVDIYESSGLIKNC